jgi:hypothetical protein
MLSSREQQQYINFCELWQDYQSFCPEIELDKQTIIDSIPAVNEYLQKYYGKWRSDAYTWNQWLISVYGHLILCQLFKRLHTEIFRVIDGLVTEKTETIDLRWRRIYIEGIMGNVYGEVAYAEHRLIASQLDNDESKHYDDSRRLCASANVVVSNIYSQITKLRSQLPCEPRAILPDIPILNQWTKMISHSVNQMIFDR